MKEKKHVAALALIHAADMDDFIRRCREEADAAHDVDSLRQVIENALQYMEGSAAISRGAVGGRISKAARTESSRNAVNRTIEVTPEDVRQSVEKHYKQRMAEMKDNPLAKYPEADWKRPVAKECGLDHYRSLKEKLPALGITEAQIVAYLQTGKW